MLKEKNDEISKMVIGISCDTMNQVLRDIVDLEIYYSSEEFIQKRNPFQKYGIEPKEIKKLNLP